MHRRTSLFALALLLAVGLVQQATGQITTNIIFGLTNQSWRYEQVADLTGTGWEQPNYNDSAWASGVSLLAFETGTWIAPFLNTVLGDPRSPDNQPFGHVRYFRTRFNWNGSAAAGTLLFNARLDDGALIYLNGVEIFRLRPPMEPITYASVGAPTPCGGDADCGDDLFTIISPALVSGTNVLAVALYQSSTNSSDIVWGTGLAGVPGVTPTNTSPAEPRDITVTENRMTNLLALIVGSPPPSYQWYKDSNPIDPSVNATATNSSFVISNMAEGDAGSYFCRVTNVLGSLDSRTAVIGFNDDDSAPVLVEAVGSATMDRVTIQFNERMDSQSAGDTFNYSIAGPDGTLGILGAMLNGNGSSVTLMTATQTSNTLYTITVNSVLDLSDNPIATDSTISFRSWTNVSCAGVLFEAFDTSSTLGNAVTLLTSHPNFPNNPRDVAVIARLDSRLAYADDTHEQYGGRMRGLFFPRESGLHIFYLASDDNGELWLSTDIQSTNKVRIAQETVYSNPKQWTASAGMSSVPAKRSAPINLVAGHPYYIETLWKEGVGGDHCSVAVQSPSDPGPPDNTLGDISSEQLGFVAVPSDILGVVTISQQPANTAVEAPARARFSVVASASNAPFVCYQWQKAEAGSDVFSDLMGANIQTYTTPLTSVADDNGDKYRVVLTAFGGSATSLVATLTVNMDVTRPTVVKVVPTSATNVAVVYSEMMDTVASTTPANYALSGGIGVTSAAANAGNSNRIDLMTAPMTIGTLYTLTMKGPGAGGTLADASGNAISPDPSSATFRAQTFTGGNVDTIRVLPTAGKLPLGALTQRGIMVRLVQVSAAINNDNTVTEQMLGGVYPSAASPLPNIAPLPLYLETGMINYNKDGPTSMDGNLVPDAQFPGYGTMPLGTLDNLAMEAVCYVELQQGIYRTLVRSDDGFRLTTALKAEDPGNSFIIGEFNGGRGTADAPVLDFCVTEAGLYPMRLTFEEGVGGAAVEWKIQDFETGLYYGVNGKDVTPGFPGGSPAAYVPPCSPKALTIQKSGSNLVITWPLANGGNLFQLQQTSALANPPSATVWNNVNVVPKTVGTTKSVTLPSSGTQFLRLSRPGSACTL